MPGAIAWVGRAPRPSAWSRAVRALSVSLLSRHPLPAKLTTDPLVLPQMTFFAASDTERMRTTKRLLVRAMPDAERQALEVAGTVWSMMSNGQSDVAAVMATLR